MKTRITKIRKRDGRIVQFEQEKIRNAIYKAMVSVGRGEGGRERAQELTEKVVTALENAFAKRAEVPSVEDVQDVVEQVLIAEGLSEIAKAYILYRQQRADIRGLKKVIGVKDDLKLSLNAAEVLKRRYLLKDERGKVIETSGQMFERVAEAIAKADLKYGKSKEEVKEIESSFYQLMSHLEFLPNSPTLMNAGTELGQLAACFVLPVEDSIEGIFGAVKNMAVIHQSGGGTGFSFSRLRPQGDVVKSTGGIASGPVSFMRVFDVATGVIKQGGKRRGANMGILNVDHPDIVEFIRAKESGEFANFNTSVAVTDDFMHAVEMDKEYGLVNPRTKEEVRRVKAREIFNEIVSYAWKIGDPGIVFIDEINRHNPLSTVGAIEATNPCGEQPLLAYESCNLGSINVSKFVKSSDGEVDWERLKEVVWICVRFLDDVIDVNRYPMPEIEEMTRANRKIGLGIMGFAELLIKLGLAYDSKDALLMGEKLMQIVTNEARECSRELGLEKGSFPNFERSVWSTYEAMRNATVSTIAPTGTISIIAGCSSGIEPLFAVAFIRNVLGGMLEINKLFEEIAKARGFYTKDLMIEMAKRGSIQDISGIPEDIKRIFVTALDISPEWHVRMQAAFQKYTDNSVSKTVNLPPDATWGDVKNVFLLAYKLKCKGITIYRYGSKEQVLSLDIPKLMLEEYIRADSEYTGECRICSV
jgi:ribonucleoside-diphosphate reductase alpha chain